jgi:hypothetical protein
MPFVGRNLLWTVGKVPFAILSRLIPHDGSELVEVFKRFGAGKPP